MIIRLCTWNIQLGLNLNRVLDVVQYFRDFRDIDIVCLQESSLRKNKADSEQIAKTLGTDYDFHQITTHILYGFAQANGLVWNKKRVAIDSVSSITLPQRHEVAISKMESFFLRFTPLQERICVVVNGKIRAKTFRLYVTHLDVVGFGHKYEQFNTIIKDAKDKEVDLCIIAGDFNTFKIRTRPSWKSLNDIAKENDFIDLTTEILWTQSSFKKKFKQKLDAIFIRAKAFSYKSWALEVDASDHLPVFSEIVI